RESLRCSLKRTHVVFCSKTTRCRGRVARETPQKAAAAPAVQVNGWCNPSYIGSQKSAGYQPGPCCLPDNDIETSKPCRDGIVQKINPDGKNMRSIFFRRRDCPGPGGDPTRDPCMYGLGRLNQVFYLKCGG